jgi:xylono-1,5-lactonase
MDCSDSVRVISRDTRDILGEGPLWSPIRQTLVWVDIFAPAIRRLNLAGGAVQSWGAPERIGWGVEREARDDLLVGLKSGFASLCLEPSLHLTCDSASTSELSSLPPKPEVWC